MATVIAEMSMSLDGFVADLEDNVGPLFDWYFNGAVKVSTGDPRYPFYVSEASAGRIRTGLQRFTAMVVGRRLFDRAGGWGGLPPYGLPVFVVTHTVPDGWSAMGPPFTFITDGVESAIAQASEAAGDGWISVGGPDIVRQCLEAQVLDEIHVNLVPVLFGQGVRFFDRLAPGQLVLDNPEVVAGDRVTHLTYRIRRV